MAIFSPIAHQLTPYSLKIDDKSPPLGRVWLNSVISSCALAAAIVFNAAFSLRGESPLFCRS